MSAAPGHTRSGALVLGFGGVLGFSLTVPVTQYALPAFGPQLVGPGRALVAALVAVPLLLARRWPPVPPLRHLPSVAVVAVGSVIGFPLLTAHALTTVSAGHAAVVLALLPAATAVMAAVRAGERPAGAFWFWCLLGTALVAGYLVSRADSRFGVGDLELLAAVVLCALGYAEGGVLSRTHPGWVVTSWALVIGSPLVLGLVLAVGIPARSTITVGALAAFAYLAVGSSLLAFFAWYRALALGGIATVGQVQLLQPVLTIGLAWILLDQPLDPVLIGVGVLVALAVYRAQRTRRPAAETRPTDEQARG
ncbi:DMT family transporter [Saccharomonospora saliphila]|uniref:DMT family transporter n=1 Tax=Saccharomonospora saliphila TaxID=369829 RepID=UPI00035DF7F0|nr:DMT family transporter [Saccharomonospora saliphila]